MQLVFTKQEMKLLADLLLEREQEAMQRGEDRDHVLPLTQKIIEHNLSLGVDELEDLEVIVKRCVETLKKQMAECSDPAKKEELSKREEMMERIEDRVTEACAMA